MVAGSIEDLKKGVKPKWNLAGSSVPQARRRARNLYPPASRSPSFGGNFQPLLCEDPTRIFPGDKGVELLDGARRAALA